jgi:hypothetical protein
VPTPRGCTTERSDGDLLEPSPNNAIAAFKAVMPGGVRVRCLSRPRDSGTSMQPIGWMLRLMTMKSPAAGSLLVLLSVGMLSMAACATSPSRPCYPSRLVISPTTVPVGGSVVLSTGPFECHASYPPGKTYKVTLGPLSLGTVPVNQDGSFRATLVIPSNVPPRQVNLEVKGSAFDTPCKDTRSSCAIYLSPLLTLRARS